MTKPKHQLQETATYASDSRKVKRLHLAVCGTVYCISYKVSFKI